MNCHPKEKKKKRKRLDINISLKAPNPQILLMAKNEGLSVQNLKPLNPQPQYFQTRCWSYTPHYV